MKRIFSKWWVWMLIILCILINLLVTDIVNKEEDPKRNNYLNGNIDTH